MSETLKTSLLVNDEEIDCHVEFVCLPGSRGSREAGTGLQLEPDEPATIEILRVTRCDTGEEIEKYDELTVEKAADAYLEKLGNEREVDAALLAGEDDE